MKFTGVKDGSIDKLQRGRYMQRIEGWYQSGQMIGKIL